MSNIRSEYVLSTYEYMPEVPKTCAPFLRMPTLEVPVRSVRRPLVGPTGDEGQLQRGRLARSRKGAELRFRTSVPRPVADIKVSNPANRRVLPWVLTAAVASCLGFVVAILGSGPSATPAVQAKVAAHYYVAQPGDTLWAIALKVQPGKDPRPLVQQLTEELHGAVLQAGQQIEIP